MRYLVAQFILHGEQHSAAVVEVNDTGELLSWAPLASFPTEPPFTVYRETLIIG